MFVAWTLEQKGNQNNEILNMLDQLDNKYENLINAIEGAEAGNGEGADEEAETEEAELAARRVDQEKEEADVMAEASREAAQSQG